MKGHEVSNPSRQPVEMSVRHSASTTFHRAKHLFMSEQIGQSSNLFSPPLISMQRRAPGRRAGGSAHRQFSSVHMKAPWHATRLNADIGNSYNLIREAGAAAASALQSFPPFQLRWVAAPFPSILQSSLKTNSWAWSKATKANMSFPYLRAYLLLSSFSCSYSYSPSLVH